MSIKALLATAIAVVVALHVNAQKAPVKFGDVSMEELSMKRYDLDSSSAAVVLADFGEVYIDVSTVKLIFERTTRIKILTKEGLDQANIEIPLFHSNSAKEKVSNLKAVTYNLESGKIVSTKMAGSAVFEERINKYFDNQKFTLPNVKEGSVIEYTYKIYSDFIDNFPNWEFQREIPTVWSEYRAHIPEFFIFEMYTQGYVSVSVNVKDQVQADYNVKERQWVARDVPAFKPEPYMTCEDDYISKINLALSHIDFPGQPTREIMGSWAKLNAIMLNSDYFGKLITGSGFLKKKVEELTTGVNEPEKKLAIIYDYVKKAIEWNKEDDRSADNTNLKKVFDDARGNSAEINLALTSMLVKADLAAQPVLTSTRDHGVIRISYPMEKQFNYVLCAVTINGKMLLLDATDRLLPMNILPQRCVNSQGLIISPVMSKWIDIPSTVRSKTTVQTALELGTDSQLTGKIEYASSGYAAHSVRKKYQSKGKDEYVKSIMGQKTWEVSASDIKNIDKIHENVIESYDITIADHVNSAGDIYYIDPFITGKYSENPFHHEKREYPVDFGSSFDRVYMIKLTIPEGYKVDELPKAKILVLPDNAGKYMYNVLQSGNMISITSILNISKPIFTQLEYPDLREFYNQVVAKEAEQIVLKKAN